MKTALILILSLVLFLGMRGQPFERSERKIRPIYLSFGVQYTHMQTPEAGQYQARVGLHSSADLAWGISGGGVHSARAFDSFLNENYFLETSYLCAFIEPILFSQKLVYLSFPLQVGPSRVSYFRQFDNWDPVGSYMVDHSMAFVLMPSMDITVALSPYVHLSLTGQYRYMTDIDLHSEGYRLVDTGVGRGWAAGVGLRFGDFRKLGRKY